MPLLSKAQERALVARIRAGDEHAKQQFIEANLRLVISVAKRYHAYCVSSVDMSDLVQAGNLGLMKAVDRYDPERGAFSTFAYAWIRQAISRTLIEQGTTIRLPIYIRTLMSRMARCAAHLFEEQGHEPSLTQVAEAMGLSAQHVQLLTQVNQSPLSLDQPISTHDERTTLADIIADTGSLPPDEVVLTQARTADLSLEIRRALSCLTKQEHEAMVLRYGLDGGGKRTLREVAEQMKLGRERARQLETQALTKLRHAHEAGDLHAFLNTHQKGVK